MASVAFIDPQAPETAAGHSLCRGVQVRAERGGLLFYNGKGPRLYFLACGPLLAPEYFGSGKALNEWLAADGIEISTPLHTRLKAALTDLMQREVIRAD